MDRKTMSRWMRRFSLLRKYIMGINSDDHSDIYRPALSAEEVSDISVQKVDATLLLRGPLFDDYFFEFLIIGTKGEFEWLKEPDEGENVLRTSDGQYHWVNPEGSLVSSDCYPLSRTLLSLVTNPDWSLRQVRHIVELRHDPVDGLGDSSWVKVTIHKWDSSTFSLETLAKTHLMSSKI